MWIFTECGFFSVVQKKGTQHLTVRARVAADLDRLRAVIPDLSATVEGAGTDYLYRATITHEAFANGLAKVARDIDYDNFKNDTANRLGHARAKAYGRVWSALLDLENE